MDPREQAKIAREMLDGDLNRMGTAHDLDELVDKYKQAKRSLEQIYLSNFRRITSDQRVKGVFYND